MGIKSSVKLPAGTMIDFAGGTIPAGWLECAGQAISRSTYAALFLAIGTTHGAGDGSTTFNLPDARGRVVFGKDNMNGSAANRLTSGAGGVNGAALGAVGGAEAVTLTEAQMPSHAHTQRYNANGSVVGAQAPEKNQQTTTPTNFASGITTAGAGSSAAHQNIPPALVANKIIKF